MAVLAVATVLVVGPWAVADAQDTLTKLKTAKYALLASYNEPPHDWFDPGDGKWKYRRLYEEVGTVNEFYDPRRPGWVPALPLF
jgi:hypothetical protein